MAKYKTKDGSDVVIPNVGVTINGYIETDQELESPVLQKVDEQVVVAAPTLAPVELPRPAEPVQTVALATPNQEQN